MYIMNGKREIERRWLMNIDDFNEVSTYNKNVRLCGYVETIYFDGSIKKFDKIKHNELRFRSIYYFDTKKKSYKITYKQGKGINRQEEEFDGDPTLFELLKNKYKVMCFNYYKDESINKEFIYKIIFINPKKVFVLIENEFKSEEEAAKFELPEYLHKYNIKEVTEDIRFNNYNLYKRYDYKYKFTC